jgi:DNA (cytosine-5)-methyltransferase 1
MGAKLTVGSLFSGIGGLDLGLERAGMEVRWQCEIDPYCREILGNRFRGVKVYGDIRELRGGDLPKTDVLCGGFPCQDLSIAGGVRKGLDGERSGLFFEYARLIGELRPRYVILENVPGLVADGIDRVLGTLAGLGYDAEWQTIQANWFGLPHIRKRILIVAYPNGLGCSIWPETGGGSASEIVQLGFSREADRIIDDLGNSRVDVSKHLREGYGLPTGLDVIESRIKALGNAVVPPIGEYIGRLIVRADGGLA